MNYNEQNVMIMWAGTVSGLVVKMIRLRLSPDLVRGSGFDHKVKSKISEGSFILRQKKYRSHQCSR